MTFEEIVFTTGFVETHYSVTSTLLKILFPFSKSHFSFIESSFSLFWSLNRLVLFIGSQCVFRTPVALRSDGKGDRSSRP